MLAGDAEGEVRNDSEIGGFNVGGKKGRRLVRIDWRERGERVLQPGQIKTRLSPPRTYLGKRLCRVGIHNQYMYTLLLGLGLGLRCGADRHGLREWSRKEVGLAFGKACLMGS
jgi:hypothetical protein